MEAHLPAKGDRMSKNYCAVLIRACAVLRILMYCLHTLRFLRSGRARLKPARYVFQHPVETLLRNPVVR